MATPAARSLENYVPHYDALGYQHTRSPFKDKSHLLDLDITHPKWLEPAPAIRSRVELQQARQKGRVPDSSYDFDGDGVVGQLDHFIGRSFDTNNDGSLSKSERLRAQKALDDGFLGNFVRGLDQTGDVSRGCLVRQRRGVIVMADNTQDVSRLSYPPHHNAHIHPPHATKTALQLSRTAEARAAGQAVGNRIGMDIAPVDEPRPPDHRTHPRTCPVSHIHERAEADHQAARARGGLYPHGTAINPEREHKTVGLGYTEDPLCVTRGQLLETRKEAMRREAEELAIKGMDSSVPLSVRRAERESKLVEFRRPGDSPPMTLTRLRDQRKQDRIEYDMQHFSRSMVHPRDYPRFSDNPEVPFWLADKPDAAVASSPGPALSRTISEPALKINQVPFAHDAARLSTDDLPPGSHTMAAGRASKDPNAAGCKTVPRWTAEIIDRGAGRNKPRLFDAIQPVRIGPMDLQSVDHTSSMEIIRNAATKRLRSDGQPSYPMASRLWAERGGDKMVAMPSVGNDGGIADAGAKGGRNMTRSPIRIASEPSLRVNREASEIPHEPRFFGSVTHMARPLETTAVRCGGFHHCLAVAGAYERAGGLQQHKLGSPPFGRSKTAKGGDQARATQ